MFWFILICGCCSDRLNLTWEIDLGNPLPGNCLRPGKFIAPSTWACHRQDWTSPCTDAYGTECKDLAVGPDLDISRLGPA